MIEFKKHLDDGTCASCRLRKKVERQKALRSVATTFFQEEVIPKITQPC